MSDLIGATERAGIEAGSGTEKPLTDEERAVIQRLLSDPFSFPIQFKTWLISFLEGSDLLLPRSSVQGLGDLLGSGGGQGVMGLLPAGLIFPYGGAVAPTGAFLCDGAPHNRVTYKRLFDAIGTVYGAGDGSTTFNVPDLRRRLPFGQGAGVGIGGNEGRVEANRHIKHHHHVGGTVSGTTSGVGDHTHPVFYFGQNVINAADSNGNLVSSAGGSVGSGGGGAHSHSFSGSYDDDTTGGFDQDQPSYLVVGYIINY